MRAVRRAAWNRDVRLVIALSAVLLGCGGGTAPFKTGDELPYVKLTGRLDVVLHRGQWWLVAYYVEDSPAVVSRAGFIDRLMERFRGHDLQSVAIVAPGAERLIHQLNESDVAYPVLIDQGGRSADLLQFEGREDRIWFVDPKGVVRFTSSGARIQDDDIRQLAEKLVLGQVSRYDPERKRWMAPGDRFPETKLYEFSQARWLTSKDVTDRFDRFVVFTADCVACSLDSYLTRFKISGQALEKDGRRVAGVFSSRFSIAEVIDQATSKAIEAPLFLAQEEIQGIEDGYYLESLIAKVVVIDTDANGFVQAVRPFDELEAEVSNADRP